MIVRALALGFSTGWFCLGYCFPVIVPLLLGRKDSTARGTAGAVGAFLFGRLIAYLAVGCVAGIIGVSTQEFSFFQQKLIPAAFIVLGTVMTASGVLLWLPHLSFCGLSARSFQGRRPLFIAGFLAGINICPPFVLALSSALGARDLFKSVLFFFFFFVATTVYLLPFLFSGALNRFEAMRRIARAVGIAAGIWFVVIGIRSLGA